MTDTAQRLTEIANQMRDLEKEFEKAVETEIKETATFWGHSVAYEKPQASLEELFDEANEEYRDWLVREASSNRGRWSGGASVTNLMETIRQNKALDALALVSRKHRADQHIKNGIAAGRLAAKKEQEAQ